MLGKKILAGVFAAIILIKLLVGLTNPAQWMGLVDAFLGHSALVLGIYGVLIIITGYYVLTTINLIDLAVAMFFTSLLIAVSIIPYASIFLKMREEIASVGLGQAWYAVVIWGGFAVVVLYRVFAQKKR